MRRTETTTTQRSPRTGALLRRLAIAGALLALAAAPAAAGTNHERSPAPATGQTGSAPTTIVKETEVKRTNSHPALPIAISGAALAIALATAAHTIARGAPNRSTAGAWKPTQQ